VFGFCIAARFSVAASYFIVTLSLLYCYFIVILALYSRLSRIAGEAIKDPGVGWLDSSQRLHW
jgi:hypothetical protein